ncbi:MAG: MurR/RpiR family transcriptional regulator, partial [Atopobiaceae bacterium]|nr:MurR/RpiR family transcriptional regulator [Atopobiaceae bacterium]
MSDGASKAMGSLYDLLLDYIDTVRVHDSTYQIAQTLVRHYTRLPAMTLREMSELCFVSQASFSRFCRFWGFEGFAEFKEAVDSANYRMQDDYTREFLLRLSDEERPAQGAYRDLFPGCGTFGPSDDDLRIMPEILDALESAERVVFFSHHFLWHIGRYFQGRMLPLGRYVELCQSYVHQEELASQLGTDDLVFICTLNGSFFPNYRGIVEKIFRSGAKVVVLTQSRNVWFLNRADYVLLCGTSNENDVGKYAALLTIDQL